MTATIDAAAPAEAAAPAAGRRLTVDQLDRIHPSREGDQLELIDGEAHVNPAPRLSHNIVVGEIADRLRAWTRKHGGLCLTAPTDVRLSPHDIVQPDVFLVLADRLGIVADAALVGAPDLVVEVLSPATRERDLGAKRALHERAGVREYWVVDPEASTVTLLALEDGHYAEVPPAKGRLASRVLPGLNLNPRLLFRSPLGTG